MPAEPAGRQRVGRAPKDVRVELAGRPKLRHGGVLGRVKAIQAVRNA